ncbi:MAG TPA: hypothetical protein VH575_07285 [Gemmataceae bacterium]|jgi:hypothetical protein
MTRTVIVQVGADGVLTLPLGETSANKRVRVTVETMPPEMTREEWLRFIEDTAGKWEGELERPPQGEYEERQPL